MRNDANDASAVPRRDEIIRAATALFLEKGYAATSMSALAQACGMQKASLYHHFPSKEALFVACVNDGYDVAIRELEEIHEDARLDDEERLRQAFGALYNIIVESTVGRLSPLIAETSRQIPSVAKAFHDGFITRQHEIIEDMIDTGVANGTFRKVDRLGLEHMIFGPIVTLSLSREMFASFDSLDALYPVDGVRQAHCDLILELLRVSSDESVDR